MQRNELKCNDQTYQSASFLRTGLGDQVKTQFKIENKEKQGKYWL